ncbi:hypothetical protein POVCU2_0068630, partial [Plasmodium ovale curtisi]
MAEKAPPLQLKNKGDSVNIEMHNV